MLPKISTMPNTLRLGGTAKIPQKKSWHVYEVEALGETETKVLATDRPTRIEHTSPLGFRVIGKVWSQTLRAWLAS